MLATAGDEFDFADAPSPYPTLAADDGPRHAATGPTLGATRDAEADGQPTAAADGDDAAGADDEDGVPFGSTIVVGQLDASVTVNVQKASSGAKLDAWIDFNADGSWGGPGEQISHGVDVVADDNTIQFDVPSFAASGETYARFRLSTTGDLAPSGAADGEVEDYQISILPPEPASGVFSTQPYISESGASSVHAADLDGDGDMDVLSASAGDDKIVWYENDGNQSYTAHSITTSADGAGSVFAVDLDRDGDLNVLSTSAYDDRVIWFENDGSQNFTAHTITTSADGALSVLALDLDDDGDMDVLSASWRDDKIAWYENDGNESFTPHTISTTADIPEDLIAADVDGDVDVLSASAGDDRIA